jgi:Tfp pilus assembly protein PilN
MIKINLSNSKKASDLSNVGGFDFTKLKIKAILLVIALIYIPEFIFVPMWEEERNAISQQVTTKQQNLAKLKSKVLSAEDMDKQLRELKAQEENLGKKLVAVKEAISVKRNPSSILLYIAKHIPAELWIKELNITKEDMTIKGEALDYTSIGNFVNNLRSSVFIRDANIVGTTSAVRESDKRRIESFEVKFSIARFDQ